MRITESRLRSIIKDIISEIAASDDEELLKIGKGPLRTQHTETGGPVVRPYDYESIDHKRAIQVFKAWCNKNDLKSNYYDTMQDFFEDHPNLRPTDHWHNEKRERDYGEALINHYKQAYRLQQNLR